MLDYWISTPGNGDWSSVGSPVVLQDHGSTALSRVKTSHGPRHDFGRAGMYSNQYLDPSDGIWQISATLDGRNDEKWTLRKLDANGRTVLTWEISKSEILKAVPAISGFDQIEMPNIQIDSRGNVYFIWQDNESPANGLSGTSCVFVVVLDQNRRVKAVLPWTETNDASDLDVAPLPDGSGFYLAEVKGQAVDVYRYSLPD